jgi:hypothetical protein
MKTPAQSRARIGPWLIMLVGPTIGLVHFMLVYLGAEELCAGNVTDRDESRLRAVVIIATILAVAAVVVGAVVAATRYRASRQPAPGRRHEEVRFVALTALVLAGLFVYFVVMLVAPMIGSQVC